MKISYRLFADLRAFSAASDGCGDLGLTEGAAVRAVSGVLGIPPDAERVILLKGDSLTFFPPRTGG